MINKKEIPWLYTESVMPAHVYWKHNKEAFYSLHLVNNYLSFVVHMYRNL